MRCGIATQGHYTGTLFPQQVRVKDRAKAGLSGALFTAGRRGVRAAEARSAPMSKPAISPDTLPADAMRFLAPASFEAPDAAAAGTGKRKVRGVAYSGGVVTGHSYWDRVAFDLDTTEVDARIPLLVDHDSSQRAGYASLDIAGGVVSIGDDTALLDNPVGRQVAADADAGFPWQLSVHIRPARLHRLEPGESAEVNGQLMDGPLTIFRNNRIREVSLTPTGADHRTHAQVFAAAPTATKPDEESMMNEQMQAQLEQATTQLAAVNAELATVRAALAERDATIRAAAEEARFAAVCALYREVGREEPKRDAVAAYLSMNDAQFAAVAADLRAARPRLPEALFGHQATGAAGQGGDGSVPPNATAEQFKVAIEGKIASERAAGRVINAAQAAMMLRGRTPHAA
jgi:hypothetical protein